MEPITEKADDPPVREIVPSFTDGQWMELAAARVAKDPDQKAYWILVALREAFRRGYESKYRG